MSLTIVSTTPYLANSSCNLFTVFVDVDLFIWNTSDHLEWLSTTTKIYHLSIGPAKSMCILDHGLSVLG